MSDYVPPIDNTSNHDDTEYYVLVDQDLVGTFLLSPADAAASNATPVLAPEPG